MKKKIVLVIVIALLALLGVLGYFYNFRDKEVSSSEVVADISMNIGSLTYKVNEENASLKVYKVDDYTQFLSDYRNESLPKVYVTEFLFDGAGMYKTYDLDDFVKSGNDVDVEIFKSTVININTTGVIELTGELDCGMIAVNSNDIEGDITIVLNNVKLDTDSKKVPAIYVYNKDITFSDHKVIIKLQMDSKNYVEGGKFKKVSLVPSDKLSSYVSYYNGDNKTNYESFTNYYGVYTESEIENVQFAKVQADNEDLSDGDAYYFYKGAGAISSDIDLYFEGSGYLEVISKNKEGIETKGNLTIGDGSGDYVISALDDCLNTTTSGIGSRNTLTIDVNSLSAVVSLDADEGDAIDSNGSLIINGGAILAIAKPGQDAGLDSENGTYINGGTALATGDMYDEVKSNSSQNFISLSYQNSVQANDLIVLLDSDSNVLFAYNTDRNYTNLVYSSKNLVNGIYNLYSGGVIDGVESGGLYTKVSNYVKGTQLGYSSNGFQGMGGMMQGQMPGNADREMPEDADRGSAPTPPDSNQRGNGLNPMGNGSFGGNATATNKDFEISGVANLFSGVATYQE